MTINSKSFDTFEELSQELDLIGFMSAYTNIQLSEINTYIKFDNIEFGGANDITYNKEESSFSITENHTYILLSRYIGKNIANSINSFIIYANNIPISSLTQETSANGELNCNKYIFYTSTTPTNIKILNTGENNIQGFKCKFLILEID